MPTKKVTPQEVILAMAEMLPLTVYQAQTLISFAKARRYRVQKVHGADREFDRMREELGKAFPDLIIRTRALNKFDELFS